MKTRVWTLFGLAFVVGCSATDEGEDDVKRTSQAAHSEVSLAGSEFEIDTDGNLKVDDVAPSSDWASVAEDRQEDLPSGSDDDAFGQGSKEDSEVPTVVDGSIPPNKSDLKTFGVYLEAIGSDRFLHMFWHRVQDPAGTTNMDFEFNQSNQISDNGVTPIRTSGDLLIQYDLANGGVNPELFVSRWIDGSEGMTSADCEASNKLPCWSKKENLSSAGDATGSINTSAIPAAESDGLGDVDPRTFGEATVDFGSLVGGDKCVSFGSAYLKSRSSDSFTAALKDFVAPTDVNISNCGTIKVVKTDDAIPPALLSGAAFDLVEDAAPSGGSPGAEDTNVIGSCVTDGSGECTFTNVLQGDYWLVETTPPANHDLSTPSYQPATVSADATVTLTFVNPRHRGAIKIIKTRKHAALGPGDHPHAGVTFTLSNGASGMTNADGELCFDNLLLGSYTVSETVPAGYKGEGDKTVVVDNKASCSGVPYAGEVVRFSNMPLSDITVSFSSQIPGGTVATIACAGLTATPPDATPNAFDDTSETFVDLVPGTYNCTVVIDP